MVNEVGGLLPLYYSFFEGIAGAEMYKYKKGDITLCSFKLCLLKWVTGPIVYIYIYIYIYIYFN